MSYTEQELNQALDRTKIQLMQRHDQVFIATVCFHCRHEFDESIPTAATNGKYIKYGPDFFMSLTPEERLFLMLHETWHVALKHIGKHARHADAKHKMLFNAAADYVINLLLVDSGFTMPKSGLINKDYADMSTEQIYNLLLDSATKVPLSIVSPDGNSFGDPGDIQSTEDDKAIEQADHEIDNVLMSASIKANMNNAAGRMPGEMQVHLNRLANPVLSWRQILTRFFTRRARTDWSWQRPNRRYFPAHYLPSANSVGCGNVAMAIDLSGSVSDEEIAQFVAEIGKVLRTVPVERFTLLQFDTAIHAETVLRSALDLNKLKLVGRGGTLVEPVIEWANEQRPDVLIVLSDGFFYTEHLIDPKLPILWLIHNNPDFTAPFGQVIHYQIRT